MTKRPTEKTVKSRRLKYVMQRHTAGVTDRAIAMELGVPVDTVKALRKEALKKTTVSSDGPSGGDGSEHDGG